jgi:hypothetical protein
MCQRTCLEMKILAEKSSQSCNQRACENGENCDVLLSVYKAECTLMEADACKSQMTECCAAGPADESSQPLQHDVCSVSCTETAAQLSHLKYPQPDMSNEADEAVN